MMKEEYKHLHKAIDKASDLSELADAMQNIVGDILNNIKKKAAKIHSYDVFGDTEGLADDAETYFTDFVNSTHEIENYLIRALGEIEADIAKEKHDEQEL